ICSLFDNLSVVRWLFFVFVNISMLTHGNKVTDHIITVSMRRLRSQRISSPSVVDFICKLDRTIPVVVPVVVQALGAVRRSIALGQEMLQGIVEPQIFLYILQGPLILALAHVGHLE